QDPAINDVAVITVTDGLKPVITMAGATDVYTATGVAYVDAGAAAADNFDGNITAKIVATSTVNTAVPGMYTVTYNVTDLAGNKAIPVVRRVFVQDTTAPVVTAPANIIVAAVDAYGTPLADPYIAAFLTAVSATDNVGVVFQSNNAPAVFPPGLTSVTFTARDAVGNIGTATATVTVSDLTAPVVTAPKPLTLNAITLPVLATDPYIAAFLLAASAVDNVDGVVAVTNNAPGQFPAGVTTVIFSSGDASGNLSTAQSSVTVAFQNIAPVAVNDAVTTAEDTAATTVNVLLNDTDANGDVLSVSVADVVSVNGGTVVNNGNGTFTYTPALNFNGADSFTYTVSDGNGGTAVGTVIITVTPVNDAPVPTAPAITMAEAVAGVSTVAANDPDIGDTHTFAVTTAAANGTATVDMYGGVNYTPYAFFNGADSFAITVTDALGLTGIVTIPVTVTPVNNAPVPTAIPTAATLLEDTYTTVTVLANDPDVGDTHTFAVTTPAQQGVATVDAYGVVNYVPNLNVNGTDSFVVTVTDAGGLSGTVTVLVTITPVNDAPVPSAPAITTAEAVAGVSTIAVNDPDVGDTHTFAVTTATANGTATVDIYGGVSYTPYAFFNGADSFAVTVTDAGGLSGVVTVPVTVTPVNNAPSATSASIITLEDTVSLGVIPTVVDPDVGDTHTFTLTTQPLKGTAGIAANRLVYTPSLNSNGADSFTYTATDAGGLSVVGTANVMVTPVNDAPVFTGTPAIAQVAPIVGDVLTLTGTATSDVDLDIVTLSYQWQAGGVNIAAATAATYTVLPGDTGKTISCVVVGNDGSGAANATVTATSNGVTVGNNAPAITLPANPYSMTVAEDFYASLLATAIDANGDPLLWDIYSFAASGTASVDAYGNISYIGNLNYNGADSFVVRVTDPYGAMALLNMNMTVIPVNDAPVPIAPAITTAEGVAGASTVAANDPDIGDTHSFAVTTPAVNGTATVDTYGSVNYTPNAFYNGADSFAVTVTDAGGLTGVVTISVTVTPVNNAPVISSPLDPYALSVAEDTYANLSVIANDPDGDPLTWDIYSAAAHGTATVDGYGNVSYIGNLNYNGPDAFTVRVSDPYGAAALLNVNVTVTPVNDAPVAMMNMTANLLSNGTFDTSATGWSVTNVDSSGGYYVSGGNPGGMMVLNQAGQPSTDPTITQTVTGLIPGLTYRITGQYQSYAPGFGNPAALSFGVLVDGSPVLQLAKAANAAAWTPFSIDFVATGSTHQIAFAAERNGDDSSYAVDNLVMTVADAVNATIQIAMDGYAAIRLTGYDPEGTPVTARIITLPAVGTLYQTVDGYTLGAAITAANTVVTDGYSRVIFVPQAGAFGAPYATFDYVVNDGLLDSAPATVTINVSYVNKAPSIASPVDPYSVTVAEDTYANFTATATDPNNDPLTWDLYSAAAHGTATVDGYGNVSYIGSLNYNGPDAFTVRVSDPYSAFALLNVNVTISPYSRVWTGAVDTNWANAANWNTGVVPGASDSVLIQAVTNQPVVGTNVSVGDLTTAPGAALTVTGGSLTVSGATNVAGALYVSGGTLALNGASNVAAVNLSGGTLGGTGNLTGTGAFNVTGTSTLTGAG
ncbi:MAG: hypothetical protein COS35_08735, partial [Zetaproteobacteria bacterium CG02_land_8_20_14_3_00_50_9]